jgi:transcriptional regulator with XRE-family HTH domain
MTQDQLNEARRQLGRQLAACRRGMGFTQQRLAELTAYSRSAIANVETGRENTPRAFWKRVR